MNKEELNNKLDLLINNISEKKEKMEEIMNNISAIEQINNNIKQKIMLEVENESVDGKKVFSNAIKRQIETDNRLNASEMVTRNKQVIENNKKELKILEFDLSNNKYVFRKYEILCRW